MKFGKLFAYAIYVGILSAVVVIVSNSLQTKGIITKDASLTFISFICWAAYFLFGASLKGAWKAWICLPIGACCALIHI